MKKIATILLPLTLIGSMLLIGCAPAEPPADDSHIVKQSESPIQPESSTNAGGGGGGAGQAEMQTGP
ncbi:MAG: hypothetical protein KF824_13285 [Fimbriimonadaceae bacterium]|nr:MAG: hypothetical protein KF824_13285 [Fimbriimonadaceae bacterium]